MPSLKRHQLLSDQQAADEILSTTDWKHKASDFNAWAFFVVSVFFAFIFAFMVLFFLGADHSDAKTRHDQVVVATIFLGVDGVVLMGGLPIFLRRWKHDKKAHVLWEQRSSSDDGFLKLDSHMGWGAEFVRALPGDVEEMEANVGLSQNQELIAIWAAWRQSDHPIRQIDLDKMQQALDENRKGAKPNAPHQKSMVCILKPTTLITAQ